MSRVMFPTDPLLGKPVRSLQTMLRVIARLEPELPAVIPDGIFGKTTLQAVSAFQRKYTLPVTGVVNEATWQAITDAYELARLEQDAAAPLQIFLEPNQIINAAHPSIHTPLLQGMLYAIGGYYDNLPRIVLTGIYDQATHDLVAALQDYAGYTDVAVGSVDKKTWQMLTGLYRAATTP